MNPVLLKAYVMALLATAGLASTVHKLVEEAHIERWSVSVFVEANFIL